MMLRIKDLREDHDLTQQEVAKILNCAQQTYSKYELGQLKIDITSLIKLADFYNVSLDYIVGTTDKKKFKNKQ
ncbi:MAG: helix-turn-helix transcriptional regulator [Firmicutes bacterium]|nr:helix-turn-helix transcriptional regulator [Bacillota bacterium]